MLAPQDFINYPALKDFLQDHQESNVPELALQNNPFPELHYTDILDQIQALQKIKAKIPSWAQYSPSLILSKKSLEQASSEVSARFKADIVKGEKLVDLSGGLGIDSFFMGEKFKELGHIEPNAELQKAVQHNFQILKPSFSSYFKNQRAEEYLEEEFQADWIFLDPSRRNEQEKRRYFLEDTEPNVPQLLPKLWQKTDNILLKAAPFLDIQRARQQLAGVKKIYVLAIGNEVKELLFHLEANFQGETQGEALNWQNDSWQSFPFLPGQDAHFEVSYGAIQEYILEPNRAILKAGAFRAFAQKYQLRKLHPNTHLYTCAQLPEQSSSIPARKFKVLANLAFQKKAIRPFLKEKRALISTRNFPLSPPQCLKKLGLEEGGNQYLWGVSDFENQKRILLTERIP